MTPKASQITYYLNVNYDEKNTIYKHTIHASPIG